MSMTLFDSGNLPAYLREAANAATMVNSEFAGGVSTGFPVLSYKGKTWSLVQGGERRLMTNADGDPRASIEVVIVRANPGLSKVYYKGGYEEGSSEKPTCFSHDGLVPSADALEQQHTKCSICPMNQWGSKITENGKKGKMCADSKRLAVVSADDPEQPILLRIPAGSLKDLAKYAEELGRRRVPMHAVVTKIGFDPTVAHQQFVFKAVRFLDQSQFEGIHDLREAEQIKQIVGLGGEGVTFEIEGEPPVAPAPKAPVAAAPRIAQQAAPAKAARPRVSEDEVAAALEGAPAQSAKTVVRPIKPAPVEAAPAPSKASRVSELLAQADAGLDEVLAALDD
jgi:hypothetical protein